MGATVTTGTLEVDADGILNFDLGQSNRSGKIHVTDAASLDSDASFIFTNDRFAPGTFTLITGLDPSGTYPLNWAFNSDIANLTGYFSVNGAGDLLFTGTTAIPEPSAVALILCGVVLLA